MYIIVNKVGTQLHVYLMNPSYQYDRVIKYIFEIL